MVDVLRMFHDSSSEHSVTDQSNKTPKRAIGG